MTGKTKQGSMHPSERLKQHGSIRVYEDKRFDELASNIRNVEYKVDTVIRMLAKVGNLVEKLK